MTIEDEAIDTSKTRESRARRKLAKLGYSLRKTPARSWLRQYYGVGYMILINNNVVEGCFDREYQASLESIELFVDRLQSGWCPRSETTPEESREQRKMHEQAMRDFRALFKSPDGSPLFDH